MRYRSPLPFSTYAPASRMSSHINSGRDARWVASTDELAVVIAMDTSLAKVSLLIVGAARTPIEDCRFPTPAHSVRNFEVAREANFGAGGVCRRPCHVLWSGIVLQLWWVVNTRVTTSQRPQNRKGEPARTLLNTLLNAASPGPSPQPKR